MNAAMITGRHPDTYLWLENHLTTTTDIYSHIIAEADEQASECLADVMLRTPAKKATG